MLTSELNTRLKSSLLSAVKKQQEGRKDILRVAISEIELVESRSPLTEEGRQNILRKIISNNEETMKASQSNLTKVKLIQENEILSEFLPATMSKDDVIIFLNAFYEQIKNQSNDGLAIKLSMAELRKMNCVFNGKDVSEIVKGIRS